MRRARLVAALRSLRPGRRLAEDDILCGPTAEQDSEPADEVVARIVATILVRALLGHAERLPVRDDRDAMHRIGPRSEPRHDRVTALVVRNETALVDVGEAWLARAEQDGVERREEARLRTSGQVGGIIVSTPEKRSAMKEARHGTRHGNDHRQAGLGRPVQL
jgi:hypothetical protein